MGHGSSVISGGAVVNKQRYIGGLKADAFFAKNVTYMNILFKELGIDEGKALEFFRFFVTLDLDEDGLVTSEQCLRAFNLPTNRFTRRLFYNPFASMREVYLREFERETDKWNKKFRRLITQAGITNPKILHELNAQPISSVISSRPGSATSRRRTRSRGRSRAGSELKRYLEEDAEDLLDNDDEEKFIRPLSTQIDQLLNDEFFNYLDYERKRNRWKDRFQPDALESMDVGDLDPRNRSPQVYLEDADPEILTFREFLLCTWNFLSLTPNGVSRLVFETFDTESEHALHENYFKSIFSLCWMKGNTFVDTLALGQAESDQVVAAGPSIPSDKTQSPSSPVVTTSPASPRDLQGLKEFFQIPLEIIDGFDFVSFASLPPRQQRIHHALHHPQYFRAYEREERVDGELLAIDDILIDGFDPSLPVSTFSPPDCNPQCRLFKARFFSKTSFMTNCRKNPKILEPIIGYQRKMREKFGGTFFWKSTARERERRQELYLVRKKNFFINSTVQLNETVAVFNKIQEDLRRIEKESEGLPPSQQKKNTNLYKATALTRLNEFSRLPMQNSSILFYSTDKMELHDLPLPKDSCYDFNVNHGDYSFLQLPLFKELFVLTIKASVQEMDIYNQELALITGQVPLLSKSENEDEKGNENANQDKEKSPEKATGVVVLHETVKSDEIPVVLPYDTSAFIGPNGYIENEMFETHELYSRFNNIYLLKENALQMYNESLAAFINRQDKDGEFTIHHGLLRNYLKEQLYQLLDDYVEKDRKYHEETTDHSLNLVINATPEDDLARYYTFIHSSTGSKIRLLATMLCGFNIMYKKRIEKLMLTYLGEGKRLSKKRSSLESLDDMVKGFNFFKNERSSVDSIANLDNSNVSSKKGGSKKRKMVRRLSITSRYTKEQIDKVLMMQSEDEQIIAGFANLTRKFWNDLSYYFHTDVQREGSVAAWDYPYNNPGVVYKSMSDKIFNLKPKEGKPTLSPSFPIPESYSTIIDIPDYEDLDKQAYLDKRLSTLLETKFDDEIRNFRKYARPKGPIKFIKRKITAIRRLRSDRSNRKLFHIEDPTYQPSRLPHNLYDSDDEEGFEFLSKSFQDFNADTGELLQAEDQDSPSYPELILFTPTNAENLLDLPWIREHDGNDYVQSRLLADYILFRTLKHKVVIEKMREILIERLNREKDYLCRYLELTNLVGFRGSRWESLIDPFNKKWYYINLESYEQEVARLEEETGISLAEDYNSPQVIDSFTFILDGSPLASSNIRKSLLIQNGSSNGLLNSRGRSRDRFGSRDGSMSRDRSISRDRNSSMDATFKTSTNHRQRNYRKKTRQFLEVFKQDHHYLLLDRVQKLHIKTALCHVCDEVIPSDEKGCMECGASRIGKNILLYRPLGSNELTID